MAKKTTSKKHREGQKRRSMVRDIEKKRFSGHLKQWRKIRNLGRMEDAANELGVNIFNYRNWEYGHRVPNSFTKVKILERVLPEIEEHTINELAAS